MYIASTDLLGTIINSNLASVLVGGFISLCSVYFVEFLKHRKEVRNKKLEISQQLASISSKMVRFVTMEAKSQILFQYHKRAYVISKEQLHLDEGKRRQIQVEDYHLQAIAAFAEFDTIWIGYYQYFGEAKEFSLAIKKLQQWQYPEGVNYDLISDPKQLDERSYEDEKLAIAYVKNTLEVILTSMTNLVLEQSIQNWRKKLATKLVKK